MGKLTGEILGRSPQSASSGPLRLDIISEAFVVRCVSRTRNAIEFCIKVKGTVEIKHEAN
ncbi:Protein of unknown function [Pyronema omphalodes CBS 100304]|uniref:Uncharacterized protein n=1 Tax=Pyronema omphalodes (strain CBS 100304) TaxID=1076935 RepID=U4LTL0_PYROM|nr:Protein of unknown function [Pyronema omphalodes CBS 100304]